MVLDKHDPDDLDANRQLDETEETDPASTQTRSFVLRLWLETTHEDTQVTWRGQIIQVRTREVQYVKSLEEIRDYLEFHLRAMGVATQSVANPGECAAK